MPVFPVTFPTTNTILMYSTICMQWHAAFQMRQMEVKVTFTMPYIKLEIQNDKSQVNFITFFLPLSVPNATENEICHFKVNIVGSGL